MPALRKVRGGSQAGRTHHASTDLQGTPGTPKLGNTFRSDNVIARVHRIQTRAGCVRDDEGEQNGRGGNKRRVNQFPIPTQARQPEATFVLDSDNNIVYVNIHFPASIMPHFLSPFIGSLSQTASVSKSQHRRHVFFSDTFVDLQVNSAHHQTTHCIPTQPQR